jgi:SET family sugar efflux transporter-like MFS transporter
VTRLLVPCASLLWGLQFALLNPALALLLVALFDASAGEVGWVLAVYNASGFLASLAVPAWADRHDDYLRPMLACAALTLALAGLLTATTSLPVAVLGLVLLGGPAGVGMSMLFAHLQRSGATPEQVVRTRALFSVAWIAGPPLAALVIGAFGDRAVLVVLAGVAVLTTAVTLALLRRDGVHAARPARRDEAGGPPMARGAVALVVTAFVALGATNGAAIAVMGLFVTEALGLDVVWAGAALGVAAAIEVPALLVAARLGRRVPSLVLIATGCLAGIAYYAALVVVDGAAALVALQLLNAWAVAIAAGTGLTLFQEVIARPGLAAGTYANARRVGTVVSGPVVAVGGWTVLGYRGVFAVCAALTALALVLVVAAARTARRTRA